jgi:DNA (cytosine-5)-methyltransferase 1
MKLYQEIIFLRHNFKGKWVVENVKPYYEYLIKPDFILQRHPFWSNFDVKEKKFESDLIRTAQIPDLQKLHDVDLSKYKISDKRKLLRNCVAKEIGEYIFRSAEE